MAHDDATWSCFTTLSGLPFGTERQDLASIPFASGGCGLRSAMRSRAPTHWASEADSLRMVNRRHPAVADTKIRCLSDPQGLRHFSAAAACLDELRAVGCDAPECGHSRQPPAPGRKPPRGVGVTNGEMRSMKLRWQLRRHSWTHQSSPSWSQQSEPCSVPKRAHWQVSPLLPCPPSPSSSPVFTHLPVWPSPRQPWPSPRRLPEGGCVGDGEGTRLSLPVLPRICREAGARTAHILNSQATKSHQIGDSRRRDRRLPSHTRQNLGSALSGAAVLDAQVGVHAGLRRGPRVRIVVARSPRPSWCGW